MLGIRMVNLSDAYPVVDKMLGIMMAKQLVDTY